MEDNLQNHIISYLISQSPKIQTILKESEKINQYGLDIIHTLDDIKDIMACSAILASSLAVDDMNPHTHTGRIKAKRVLLSIVNDAYRKYYPENIH